MGEIQVPSYWKEVSFGEVCTLRKEPVQPTDNPDIAYVGLEHIDSGHPKLNRVGTASEVKSSKSKFYFGDILYGKLRPYLDKAVLANFEGICSTDILVFKANGLIKPEFLIYLVHTKAFIDHAIRTTRGVNHPRTSWVSLIQFYFRLPPLSEQKTIAHTLRTIQKAKETRQRELKLERERKAALMQYLFTHGTNPQSNAFQKTRFGKVPQHWKIVPLEKCAFIQTGTAKGRKFQDSETVILPYLRVANVQDGYLDLSEIKGISIRKSEVKRYSLQVNDVVLTEGGDPDKLGRGFIWEGQIPNCIHQNHIFAVRTNREILLPEYLAYLVQSDYGKAYFLSVAHRTTNLASINSTKLKAFPTLVPDISEQKRIITILQICDRKIQALEKEIALTDELFHAMLEQLMTGKISTQPLTETYV